MNGMMLVIFVLMIVILLGLTVSLAVRVKKLEERSTDLSADDVAAYVEQMREIMIESERMADRLDETLRNKEALLEDLSALLQNSSLRLQNAGLYTPPQVLEDGAKPMSQVKTTPSGDSKVHDKIYEMLLNGNSMEDIARKLGLTIADIEQIIDIADA